MGSTVEQFGTIDMTVAVSGAALVALALTENSQIPATTPSTMPRAWVIRQVPLLESRWAAGG